ncbi:MAG: nuclear transport factor 2 family protein [Candidatus Nanohaloarchaea archaeon]
MGKDIHAWLSDFKEAWIEKNVDEVMEIFTDDVDYFETPFIEFENKKELRDEWNSIEDQKDIDLDLEIFNSEGEKHTVLWSLEYKNCGEAFISKGVYLIKLNSENKCYQFAQYPITPE